MLSRITRLVPLCKKRRRGCPGRRALRAALGPFVGAAFLVAAACDTAPAPQDPCAATDCGHGSCEPIAGGVRCNCEEAWGGLACERCADGFHDDDEGGCAVDEVCVAESCGRGGLCDDAGGRVVCQCDAGFAGDRCDRCASGYHEDGDWCAPDAHCEDAVAPCSAHGECDDSGGRLSCRCDEGWTGAACDACAEGWHPTTAGAACEPDEVCFNDTCSGFGRCELVVGLARCACDPPHTGPRCDFCDVGHHADHAGRCVPDGYCSDGALLCGFHGACVDPGAAARCVCEEGWGGPTCARCAAGWHALESGACVPDDACRPTSCNARGACAEADGGIACECDPGYGGPRCETCADDAALDLETGECVPSPPCPAQGCGPNGACEGGTCACDDGYAGAACDACGLGYAPQGGLCLPATACAPELCSGAGAGACDDATGVPLCTCSGAYTGPNCELCALGYHRDGAACVADEVCLPDTCATGGVCYLELGRARCACPPPAAGERCEACVTGYHLAEDGADGVACVVDEICSEDLCDHGTCEVVGGAVECECHAGWAGARCKACATGFHYDGETETCTADVFCAAEGSSCSDHGECIQGDGVILCSCDSGYAGEACEGCANGYEADGAGGCSPATPPE